MVAAIIHASCTNEACEIIGSNILNFVLDDQNQGYHSLPETWQKNFGYTKLYDDIFGTCSHMDYISVTAKENNKTYVLWLWKGDYWNLGTGAEMGLYTTAEESKSTNPDSPNAHFDAVDFCTEMRLSLFEYPHDHNLKTYFNWQPEEKQWWITGFNSYFAKEKEMVLSDSVSWAKRMMKWMIREYRLFFLLHALEQWVQ